MASLRGVEQAVLVTEEFALAIAGRATVFGKSVFDYQAARSSDATYPIAPSKSQCTNQPGRIALQSDHRAEPTDLVVGLFLSLQSISIRFV